MEEIEANFKDVDFFSGVMEGLEEALAYKRGKASAETIARKRALPTVNIKEMRLSLGMTQRTFAEMLESGKSTPTPTAKKLMYLIQEDHSLVQKLQ